MSIGGRPTSNLLFADDISLFDGSSGELQDLTNRLILTGRARMYGMKVSTEKYKIVTNNMKDISADISMNDQQFEEVTSFKYPGATLHTNSNCSAEICSRITSAMPVIARFNGIC